MYSWLEKCLEDAGINYGRFGNIRIVFYFVLIIASSVFLLKYALKRRSYLKIYPALKLSFFDPWGHTKCVLDSAKVKGININVYTLQVLMGTKELFKHESFYYISVGFSPLLVITKAKAVEELISGSKHLEKHWIYSKFHRWLGTGLVTSSRAKFLYKKYALLAKALCTFLNDFEESNGSKWKSRRKLLTPSFHFGILKDFLPIFNEQSQLLVKLLKEKMQKPWIDIVEPITLCSLDIVCETTLGVSIGAQQDSVSEYVRAVSRALESFMERTVYPPHLIDWYYYLTKKGFQFKKDVQLLHDFTRTVITNKKHKLLNGTQEMKQENTCKKRKALMDLLLEEHIKNKTLTEEDIREEVDTFAFAGHDTTSMGMSWALYLIGLYKDVQEKLHEEIDRVFGDDCDRFVTTEDLKDLEYLERVLKESQRLYPTVPIIARSLSEDTVLYGKKVPKEVGIIILQFALHRDETVFPNPEKFDPDRFLPEISATRSPFAYIPFSAGPRNCIGQKFAMMEEKVVIANILRNFTLESLDPRDKMMPALKIILRADVPIRIKLTPRRST